MHDENLPPDLDRIANQIRSGRAEMTDNERKRIRLRMFPTAGAASAGRAPRSQRRFGGVALRSRLVVALTLLIVAGTTGGTIAATSGGTSGTVSASVTQYNSQCGTGTAQGQDCWGNDLTQCADNCNGSDNTACKWDCFGNNNTACTTYCVGSNNVNCTSYCWGQYNPKCQTNCYKSTNTAPNAPPACTGNQTPTPPSPPPGAPLPNCYTNVQSSGNGKQASVPLTGRAPPVTVVAVRLRSRLLFT